MSLDKELTYLEDVEPAPKIVAPTIEKTMSTTTTLKVNDVQGASIKRQRSIADMFPSKASETSSSKRQKTGSAGSAVVTKKTVLGVTPLNSIPLNIEAFSASLTEESRVLLKLEIETMGKSWLKVLKDEIQKPYFISLKRWLASEGLGETDSGLSKSKIFPPAREIYSWTQTPLGRVRAVIIGQDPYHSPGQAHGVCGVHASKPRAVPMAYIHDTSIRAVFLGPESQNDQVNFGQIYAELKAEYPEFETPKHGNLSTWTADGVLLLNTCLTVRAHEPGSHSNKGWEKFTDHCVDVIDQYGGANLARDGDAHKSGRGRGVVFLAWGAWAQKRVARLDKKKHLILTSAHPSPFSAYRGFLGNNHFQTANAWLEDKYGKDGIVDWCKLD